MTAVPTSRMDRHRPGLARGVLARRGAARRRHEPGHGSPVGRGTARPLVRRPPSPGGGPLPARSGAPGAPSQTERARLLASAGVEVDVATLGPRARRAVAVARDAGAPLLEALDGVLAAEDDDARAARAVEVASAPAKLVAGGLLAAPVVLAPAVGRLAGADLAAFYGSPPGIAVLAVCGPLLLVGGLLVVSLVRRVTRPADVGRTGRGRAWAVALVAGAICWWLAGPLLAVVVALVAGRLARRGDPRVVAAGLDEAVDLAATALSAGLPAPAALRLAADQLAGALPELVPPLRRLAFDLEMGPVAGTVAVGGGTGLDQLVSVIATAHEAGAPLVPALRRLAARLRADGLARVLAAAERLPVQLTFPTTLCLLPATLGLVGAPIVHAGLVAVGT